MVSFITSSAFVQKLFKQPMQGLEKHQIDMIMRECHLAVFVFVVASSLIFLLLRDLETRLVDIWFKTLCVIHFLESVVIVLYRRKILVPPDSAFFRVFVWVAGFFTGFVWSFFLFFPPMLEFSSNFIVIQMLLVFGGVVLVLAAGSTYYWPAYISIFSGLSIPPIYLILSADFTHGFLLLFTLFFILLIHSRLVHVNNQNSTTLYREQHRNKRLVGELEIERNNSVQLYELAQQSLRDKDQFIAAASHDLRQPLHAFGLFLEAIKKHVASEEGNNIRESMQISLRALDHSFSGLLDIANLNSERVDVNEEVFDLHDFIASRVEPFRFESTARNLEFTVNGPQVAVQADPLLLDRILRNLVSNAIKFTQAGSIRVEWKVENEEILLSVKDTGIGIPASELELVFNEYHRVEYNHGSNPSGLGLGLSIVKKMCDLTDTKINVVSKENSGSEFTLTLPIGNPDSILQPDTQWEASDLHGLPLIVIDDNAQVLEGMKEILTGWGCRVVAGQSRQELLDTLFKDTIDPMLIIADYQLKNGDNGVQVIKYLRDEYNKHIPALVISGDTSRDFIDEMDLEGFELLNKPVLPGELRDAILRTLHPAKL